jgi:hypothetical protein
MTLFGRIVVRANGGLSYRYASEFAASLAYLLSHPDVARRLYLSARLSRGEVVFVGHRRARADHLVSAQPTGMFRGNWVPGKENR